MSLLAASKKDWTLTQVAFDQLLSAFDANRERAGQKYESVRRKLTEFFEARGSESPADQADETMNRVARKIVEGERIESLERYFYGVARLLWMETLRAREKEPIALDLAPTPIAADNEEQERGTLIIPRGWISVDGKIRGKRFRFVTTHLESFHLGVQAVQASELLQGPCNTELPVIIAGDLNTESASGNPVDNAAYQIILGSGFVDAWTLLHPEDPGLTWPLHGEDPFTAFSTPSQRIDLVLFRGELRSLRAKLIGQTPAALTSSGLWPSDHAGVIARFKLKP